MLGCVWALVIVAVVDLACRAVLPGGELIELEDEMRARVDAMPAPDVEVIGDSVARSGFISGALADDALTAANVSTPASGAPKSYLLLAQQFATGRIPKVLVIAHSPHTFGQVRYEVLVGGFARWREIPALALDAEKWTDVLYGVLTRISYILMHRDSFRDLVTDGNASFFLNRAPPDPIEPDMARLEEFRRSIVAGTLKLSGRSAEIPPAAGDPFGVKEMNDRYFKRILAMAKQRGVEVFWVTMPTPQNALNVRSNVHYEQDMLAYLRQFEASGQLHILQGPFTVYPDSLFRDWLHLNEAGAVRFACDLERIKAPVVAAAHRAKSLHEARDEPSSAKRDRFAEQLSSLCPAGMTRKAGG